MKKQNVNKRRKITREYLIGATYRYLERYASTEGNLKNILHRKVSKILRDDNDLSHEEKVTISQKSELWIDEIVEKSVKQGLVDDYLYARTKAKSYLRSGNSKAQITHKLYAKLVQPKIVSQVLAEIDAQMIDSDVFAAAKYIRKRRFGAFRVKEKDEKSLEKEKNAMFRAGFSYETTLAVLKGNKSDLEDIIFKKGKII